MRIWFKKKKISKLIFCTTDKNIHKKGDIVKMTDKNFEIVDIIHFSWIKVNLNRLIPLYGVRGIEK